MPLSAGPTWTSQSLPDYVSLQFDLYIASGAFTYNRFGDFYSSLGANRAYPNPFSRGVSLTAGYAVTPKMCDGLPTRSSLNNFLTDWSVGAGYFDVVGASVSANSAGFAIQPGVGLGFGGGSSGSFSPGMITRWRGNAVGLPPPPQ